MLPLTIPVSVILAISTTPLILPAMTSVETIRQLLGSVMMGIESQVMDVMPIVMLKLVTTALPTLRVESRTVYLNDKLQLAIYMRKGQSKPIVS